MSHPVVRVTGLRRTFGEQVALHHLDLAIRPGELYGLVGPDGAGKTTAIRLIAGLVAPTAGEVRVCGEAPLENAGTVREALGYMPQQYSLYGDLTVDENLHFFGRMFCLKRTAFRERRDRLLAITRLTRFTDRRADALSGGMHKKLALACALLHRPRVLLLDEPTNGVDPVSRRELWELLYEFAHEGMAILISTPYMDEAARCHRVGLLHQGRLLQEGEPATLLGAFRHGTFLVEGAGREAIDHVLHDHPLAMALSPAGERVRLVVRRGGEEAIAQLLAPLGARLIPTRPDFEDLFLVQTQATAAE